MIFKSKSTKKFNKKSKQISTRKIIDATPTNKHTKSNPNTSTTSPLNNNTAYNASSDKHVLKRDDATCLPPPTPPLANYETCHCYAHASLSNMKQPKQPNAKQYIYLFVLAISCVLLSTSTFSGHVAYAATSNPEFEHNELQTLSGTGENDTYSPNHHGNEFAIIFSDDTDLAANKSYKQDETSGSASDLDVSATAYGTYKYPLPAKIVVVVCAGTASIITVCGYLLGLCSFFLDRQIRNPTNYFILSLSFSDFIIGSISIPFLTLFLIIGELDVFVACFFFVQTRTKNFSSHFH